MRFARKSVLITGAGSGIGRATAELMASGGAELVLVDLNDLALESLELSTPARCLNGDVSDEAFWS
jgi:NAD(P)-dependent dehydrogenase (short-subunit alcohol dehydrogenase family)